MHYLKLFKEVKVTIKYGRESLSLEDVFGALRSKNLEMIGKGLQTRVRSEKKF